MLGFIVGVLTMCGQGLGVKEQCKATDYGQVGIKTKMEVKMFDNVLIG